MGIKKAGKFHYKRCQVSYSAYGDKNMYSATAHIYMDSRTYVEVHSICLKKTYQTIEKAEQAIIRAAEKIINDGA